MESFELPADLVEFLRQGKQLEFPFYEFADVVPDGLKLLALGKHELGEVWIDSENHPFAYTDPHFGEKGYYAVPAVNLVAECNHFEPDFILLWLTSPHRYEFKEGWPV